MALVPTPYLESVYDVTPQQIIDNEDYFAWLNEKLGEMTFLVVSDVSANFPAVPINIAVNVPRVKNDLIPVLEPINNTPEYDSSNWAKMLLASYDHVLNNEFALVVTDLEFYDEHNFTTGNSVYLSGKIPDKKSRYKWSRVDRALNYAEVDSIPLKYIDSITEAFEHGFFWYGYNNPNDSGFGCGGCNG